MNRCIGIVTCVAQRRKKVSLEKIQLRQIGNEPKFHLSFDAGRNLLSWRQALPSTQNRLDAMRSDEVSMKLWQSLFRRARPCQAPLQIVKGQCVIVWPASTITGFVRGLIGAHEGRMNSSY